MSESIHGHIELRFYSEVAQASDVRELSASASMIRHRGDLSFGMPVPFNSFVVSTTSLVSSQALEDHALAITDWLHAHTIDLRLALRSDWSCKLDLWMSNTETFAEMALPESLVAELAALGIPISLCIATTEGYLTLRETDD